MKKYSQEIIIAFLEGELDKELQFEIEQKIIQDENFAQEVATTQNILLGLGSYLLNSEEEEMLNISSEELDQILKDSSSGNNAPTPTKQNTQLNNVWLTRFRLFFILSGIAVMLLIGYYLIRDTKKDIESGNQLYAYLLEIDLLKSSRNNPLTTQLQTELKQADRLYKQEEYNDAIISYQKSLSNNKLEQSDSINILVAISNCYIMSDNLDKAETILSSILTNDNISQGTTAFLNAKYTLAWIYIESNQKQNLAIRYLEELKVAKHREENITNLLNYLENRK